MKKKITLLLSCATIMLSSLNVFSAVGLIIDNKTYVPVRGVFEELGFNVTYDKENATAIISDSNFTIKIPKDKNYFLVNSDSIKPDSPQKIVNGNMYLPLRAIADSIGADTSWNSETKIAHVSYKGKTSYISTKTTTSTKPTTSSPSIIKPLTTNNGTTMYSLTASEQKKIIAFAEQNIKDGNPGLSILGQRLKYPHSATCTDGKVNYVFSSTKDFGSEYNCKYFANVYGYVTAQLPTGLRKETKYTASVYFNITNNKVTDLTLNYVSFSE